MGHADGVPEQVGLRWRSRKKLVLLVDFFSPPHLFDEGVPEVVVGGGLRMEASLLQASLAEGKPSVDLALG